MKKAQNTKKKIVNISLELFYENGYEETSLREIAQKVGIKHPSLFSFFKNKSEIAQHIIIRYFNGLNKICDEYCKQHIEFLEKRELIYYALHYLMVQNDLNFAYLFTSVANASKESFFELIYQFNPDVKFNTYQDKPLLFKINLEITIQVDLVLIKYCLLNELPAKIATMYFVNHVTENRLGQASLGNFSKEEVVKFYDRFWDILSDYKINVYDDILTNEIYDN